MTQLLHWGFLNQKPGMIFSFAPILPIEPEMEEVADWRYHAAPLTLSGLASYVFINAAGSPYGAFQLPMTETELRRVITLLQETNPRFNFQDFEALQQLLGVKHPVALDEGYPVIII